MKLQSNMTRECLPRLLSSTTVPAAVFVCLAMGARTLIAGDNGEMTPGGGDAIGSLPFTSPPPPEHIIGEQRPSIVLEAPTLAAIQTLVVDAWGTGYAEFTNLGEAGVRVELQGEVSLVLDRNQLHNSPVIFGLDVTQGFSGGLAVITQNQQVLRTQELPVEGDLDLPLGMLSDTGALDSGGLELHSISLTKRHHKLDLSTSGGTLRLVAH
jgi:hypothetical protein